MNTEGTKREKTIKDLVAYYRELHPQYFSDSKVVYETPLTRELFDLQLEFLSTKKKQSEFENFVVECAKRIITPNIKRQTGPDGGGDGKVDAETFDVSSDISDKWYIIDGGASRNEKWAFAISCKKQWKPKVESDVEKIVDTDREYTKVLFFSNQYIKSSTRAEVETNLKEKYNIQVSIFDGSWCSDCVFTHGCKDIALECLSFSEDYKRKKEIISKSDKEKQDKLEEIEKGILRCISGMDTGYIEELQETYILSRRLERPRQETEGRFARALRECEQHGTIQQKFNIIYDHAWTSYFWFEDIDAMYSDYLKLKDFIKEEISVNRLEKITNILTNLINASRADLFDSEKTNTEVTYIKNLEQQLQQQVDLKPSSLLYLQLYIAEQTLIQHALNGEEIDNDIEILKPLLLDIPHHIDINFESQYEILRIMHQLIDDNQKYDELIDDLTFVLRNSKKDKAAAIVDMECAIDFMEKEKYKQAIKHFSCCIRAFEKEECLTELIKTSGMLGFALWELGLPYSAEAYFVKAASLLIKEYYTTGNIPHLLQTILQQLCKIELMLGRLVMFFNWYELMTIISNNGIYAEEKQYNETNTIYDGAWACRFAASDLNNPIIAVLPDILERINMPLSTEFLKHSLGYSNDSILRDCSQEKMLNQSIFDQFLFDLNIASNGDATLHTTVNNCNFHIKYHNTCENQIIAEIFLAAIESMLATMDIFEVVTITQDVNVEIIVTTDKSQFNQSSKANNYQLLINKTHTNEDLWKCISMFFAHYFCQNSIFKEDFQEMIENKQNKEKIMDRVNDLLYVKQSISNVLGNSFKNKIEDWQKITDRIYYLKNKSFEYNPQKYRNEKQQKISIATINKDMNIWNNAGWKGCGFIFDRQNEQPPILGLIFDNMKLGEQIVSEWNQQKSCSSIVIYIIKGINALHPTWYRVCIAPFLNKNDFTDNRYVTTLCRKHTMTPNNNLNINIFEQMYQHFNGCLVTAIQVGDNKQIILSKDFNNAHIFNNVEFRNAWEIGFHDMAKIALEANDYPYIPDDKKDIAPINELIK
ncbi:MAG: hypothetical protein J6Z01_00835 [Bacteroidales bacterium]|nr:hypothetical protein [Bacteroidales bacterium]